ncbi:hypothetical protein MMC10_001059 [Thelotrema lepadinum]|nr:hypothetical protein [Thelotrema lepadinum]
MSKKVIDEALRSAKDLGIRNILALRGDPPREEEYRIDSQDFEGSEEFVWAVDLVRYIKKQYGDYFCIGVAGYPEGHSDESHPVEQGPKHDMPYLLEKVQAGADFIMTQLFFDESAFISYEKLVRGWDGGAMKDTTIIPGLVPIQSFAVIKRLTQLSHARMPQDILKRLQAVKGDDDKVKEVGIEILSSIVGEIKTTPSPSRRGFHFFTLNLEKAVSLVLEKSDLIPLPDQEDDQAIVIVDEHLPSTNGYRKSFRSPSSRRPSSPHNHITTESRTTSSLEPPSRATELAISHGIGSLGREATWDDYPNGRFGDARSPAFGEIDGYGTSLHQSPTAARRKWGSPASHADISQLFVKHLKEELDQVPWSEGPLNAETLLIQPQLCRLIEQKGWWSIASQPAADGIKSADPILGWGPKGGFIFQKAFVEFWISASDWHSILKPHLLKAEIKPLVSWYASPNPNTTGNSSSELNGRANGMSDFEGSSPADSVNSVTWGSFPGKEIVSPTIIEEMSFRAWAEEAFGIWREWERCYAVGSPSRELIKNCRENMWLVNVIGHVYQEPEGLWDILMGA